MKALRYLGPRDIRLEEMPRPEIGTGEVLVEVRACGICATDVKTFKRGHPKIKSGTVLGHEVTGVIAEAKGTPGWQIGERVVVAPYVPCGACRYCRRGQQTLCEALFRHQLDPGGFSQFLRVPQAIVEQGLQRLPGQVSFEVGTFVEPLACCYHSLEAMEVSQGDSLLIVGDGPMGILHAELAQSMGLSPIIMSGITPERLARGARAVDYAVDPRQTDLKEIVLSATDGRGADRVVVATGSVQVAQESLTLVGRGGTVNLFAGLTPGSSVGVDVNRIHYEGIHIMGTFGFAPTHFERALAAISSGTLNLEELITARVPLSSLETIFPSAIDPRGIKPVVIIEADQALLDA